jgi:ribonuclease BN (tRNA processing enzyme)
VTLTAFEVDHATAKPAFGYRIDYGGHSVVFSGDTRLSENLIRFLKGADLLVHEVAWARPELLNKSEAARIIIGLHTTPEEAGTLFCARKATAGCVLPRCPCDYRSGFHCADQHRRPETYAKNL